MAGSRRRSVWTRVKRSKWIGYVLLLNLMALPAGLFPFRGALFGEMPSKFSATVQVDNPGGEALWVTPIGRLVDGGGRRVPLAWAAIDPTRRSQPEAVWKDMEVEPGGAVTLRYDWSGVRLSELVVRDAQGEHRWISIDRALVDDAISRNVVFTVDLNEASSVEQVTPGLLAAQDAAGTLSRPRGWWLLFAWPWLTVLPVALWWWRSGTRGTRRRPRMAQG